MKQFERSLPMMLHRALDTVMPEFRAIFHRFGLTEQQWRVLRVLWECDCRPLVDVTRVTCIPGPSLVGVIDRLVRAGLLERRRSDSDRRVVRVCLTAKGKTLEPQVAPLVNGAYQSFERSIEPADWSALMKGLDAVIESGQGKNKLAQPKSKMRNPEVGHTA